MTFKEYHLEVKAYRWRFDNEMSIFAHFTAVLANPHYKKKLKADDIYSNKPKQVVDLEERRKRFEKAVALMGPEAIPVRTSK